MHVLLTYDVKASDGQTEDEVDENREEVRKRLTAMKFDELPTTTTFATNLCQNGSPKFRSLISQFKVELVKVLGFSEREAYDMLVKRIVKYLDDEIESHFVASWQLSEAAPKRYEGGDSES